MRRGWHLLSAAWRASRLVLTAPWRMLAATWRWLDDRGGLTRVLGPLFSHRVPGELASRAGWMYVLGTATLVMLVVEGVTGIALATAYVPSTAHAFESLQFITNDAPFGRVLRGLHYYGASAMILLVGLHLLRVFLTGSFKFPRELNWLTGVGLLGVTFLLAFTGQLLRWDSDAIGTVLVASEQAGRVPLLGALLARFILAGENIGAATLSRFFAFHVFVLGGLLVGIVTFHLYLVIHNGISEPAAPGQPVDRTTYRARYEAMLKRTGRPYFPDAVWREVLFGAGVALVVFALALVIGPLPLREPPDPANTQIVPRPDWYLRWAFALLALAPHALEDILIVFGPLLTGVALLALPFTANGGERHPRRRPWAVGFACVAVLVVGSMTVIGSIAPWSPRFETTPLSAEAVGVSSPQVATGARVFYDKGCQFCHSVLGEGGIRGPDLTDVARRLTAADTTARILTGPPGMPSYNGNLTDDELHALLSFLEATAQQASSSR